MPKKPSRDKEIKKIKDKRKIKEIPSRIKQIKELEEPEIEEDIKDEEIINNNHFQEFLSPTDVRAHVLERITNLREQEPVDLEQGLFDIASTANSEDNRNISNYALNQPRYSASGSATNQIGNEQERDYQISTNMQAPTLNPIERQESQRGFRKVEFLDPLAGMRNQERTSMEPEMIQADIREEERRLPFEKQERKYRKVKF